MRTHESGDAGLALRRWCSHSALPLTLTLVLMLGWAAGRGVAGGEPVLVLNDAPVEDAEVVETTNLDRLLGEGSPLASGPAVVFFGDSITEAGGYIDILRRRLAAERPGWGVSLVNRGHSGYRVPMIQPLLQKEVLDSDPDLVVIYIGINDVWQHEHGAGTSAADFEAGLRDMLTRCNQAGVEVVLCSPSIIGELPRGSNRHDERLEAYSTISEKVAGELGATFCDLRGPFFAYLKEHKSDRSNAGVLTTDGVHMLPAGDALLIETMAGAVWEALTEG